VSGIGAIIYRDWRQRITNLGFVFWDVFVPVAYLGLFGTGFNRTIADSLVVDGHTLEYTAFLLPGVLAMTAFSIAMNTAWTFFMDKDSGIFWELLTYPITRRQLLIGKVCFNVCLSLLGALMAVAVGVLAMDVPVRWDRLPVTALIIVVTTAGWFFLMSIFAVRLHRMDSFNTLTSAAYIFLMFLSSLFYPLDDVPGWFEAVSRLNPMTWQVDMLRLSLLGIGSPSLVLVEAIAFGAFTVVCLALAVRTLDRAD
jgi:ABC-2 type transport system permease protein